MKKILWVLIISLALLLLSACTLQSSLNDLHSLDSTSNNSQIKINNDAKRNYKSLSVGESLTFGHYEQDGEIYSEEDIEWLVLAKTEHAALLISKYALSCQPYYTVNGDVTWETSSVRKWLNDTFFNKAFSVEEQRMIFTTNVVNDDNDQYGTKGGNNTYDKVFLLSTDEANEYFKSDEDRKCPVTDYVLNQGVFVYGGNKVDGKPTGPWWLRSPGMDQSHACCANENVSYGGYTVNTKQTVFVRPAMWISVE